MGTLDELERLKRLLDEGAVEEYEKLKRKLLGSIESA